MATDPKPPIVVYLDEPKVSCLGALCGLVVLCGLAVVVGAGASILLLELRMPMPGALVLGLCIGLSTAFAVLWSVPKP